MENSVYLRTNHFIRFLPRRKKRASARWKKKVERVPQGTGNAYRIYSCNLINGTHLWNIWLVGAPPFGFCFFFLVYLGAHRALFNLDGSNTSVPVCVSHIQTVQCA